MTNREELKPCDCGKGYFVHLSRINNDWVLSCPICKVSISANSREAAIAAWNNRESDKGGISRHCNEPQKV